MTTDLQSIGLGFNSFQDAIQAAIATEHLSVIGEVRGGQLVRFEDPSGARLHILGVEPFSTFPGFNGTTTVTAHVSSIDDVLALIEIVGDDPSQDTFDKVIHTASCALAQGPLLVDEGTQTFEHVSLSALASSFTIDADAAAFAERTGKTANIQNFVGADAVVGNATGSKSPSAEIELAGVVNSSVKKINELTGQKYWMVHLALPVPMDVLVPGMPDQEPPQPGMVVSGSFVLTGDVIAPSGCGDSCGGSCSCGSGGCGGH